ncbi:MAG TPA: DNA methyltransferase [Pyrinomonadaceae bacterium]
MGELHDALLASGYGGHQLEVFLVRLVYCLFADDTGIFPRDGFRFFLEERTDESGRDTGAQLNSFFQLLDTAPESRQTTLDEDLRQFPHVNGALFREDFRAPTFDRQMRQKLLEACSFDWSKVSPAIFGSLFQSVMNPAERRELGAHYTSERNILKAVRGLFLDDLRTEFERIKDNASGLRRFHDKIASLRFFDPACGAGNFLVITYREMRRLELDVLKRMRDLSGSAQQRLYVSAIDVDAFYGIEIEEFASQIATVALWITDHLANRELALEFGVEYNRLPLRRAPNIHKENALRVDWAEIISPEISADETRLYILGNPPFVGKQYQNAEQKADMDYVCSALPNNGVLDYVAAWYVKAAQFIQDTKIKVAFVSTNSITQGEQVGALWSWMIANHVKINFAHRTFRWTNEARGGHAAVYCIIVGFALQDEREKRLYDYERPDSEPAERIVKNINPYLVDADDIVVQSRRQPISDVPPIVFGSMPNDGGHLLLDDDEKAQLLRLEPQAERFIRRFYGSREFINNINRWCLWLVGIEPNELRQMPEVRRRVEAVRQYRLESNRETTRRLADVPTLFGEMRQPTTNYLLIPRVSSERRRFIPTGFLTANIIAGDSSLIVPDAIPYHFGVISSTMHNAWMRQVCVRLKSDYRYSNNLVYNNFPFPDNPTAAQRERVEAAANRVLEVRRAFPNSTLADLYDPNTMPPELVRAHRDLDREVDLCYRRAAFNTELERLQFLFARYRELVAPLAAIAIVPRRRRITR